MSNGQPKNVNCILTICQVTHDVLSGGKATLQSMKGLKVGYDHRLDVWKQTCKQGP